MLNELRKASGTWIVRILFGLLVVSFAVWGIGDIFRAPGRDAVVIEVADRGITGNELAAAYQRYMERMRPAFRDKLTPELARQLGFVDAVVQDTVRSALLDAAAQDLGIAVSDEVVRQNIRGDPSFRGLGGAFDQLAFEQALRRAGYTEEGYVQLLRRAIARTQILNSVRAGAKAPDPMVEALYRLRQEKRVAEVLRVPDASVADVPEPGDAALDAFYEENREMFRAPEYRALTVVKLDAETIAGEIAVSADEMRRLYENSPDRFRTPEVRHVRQILFEDEETAQAAHRRLAEGAGFAAVAKELTGREAGDLELGRVTEGELPEPLGPAAFALAEGAVSEPVKSPLGWHILQVTEIEPGTEKSFEEAREELRDEIAAERAIDAIYDLSARLEDALAGGASLEEAAAGINVTPIRIEAVDESGLGPDGEPVEGLPGGDFLEVAFSTAQGDQSFLTETPDGGYFILRVDRVTPSAIEPLAAVRDEAVAAWKAERRHERARETAERIAAEVGVGRTLAEAAEGTGFAVETTELVTRSDAEQVDKLDQQLRETVASDLVAQYEKALHDRYSVDIDSRAIDALF